MLSKISGAGAYASSSIVALIGTATYAAVKLAVSGKIEAVPTIIFAAVLWLAHFMGQKYCRSRRQS